MPSIDGAKGYLASLTAKGLTKLVTDREKELSMKLIGQILSYPRGIFSSLFIVVDTVVMSVVTLFCSYIIKDPYLADRLIRKYWARLCLRISGVRVQLRGADVERSSKGCLVLFNHTSHVDILVLYGYVPLLIRFGAKIELFKIPFFGAAMTSVGVLPIDRRQRSKVMQIYQAAIPRFAKGESFALAPEGTRQEANELGAFKRGPFEFAIQAGVDVVPVVIAGARHVLPKGHLWVNTGRLFRTVVVDVLDPVPAANWSLDQVDALRDFVRGRMSERYQALNAELGL